MAAYHGTKFAVGLGNGTDAIWLALMALGIGPGDEVITHPNTFFATAEAIWIAGATAVFVDCCPDSKCICPDKIEAAITPKTKAIIVVHLHGLAVNMEKVLKVARKHGLKVIEDACQSHGATFKGKKVGQWGDCAAFSLNQNKCLCSGEGGMLTTNDQETYTRARMLWSFGETRTPVESRDYHAYALGWMYRNNDLTAAFGRAQLTKLDGYMATLKENAKVLLKELKSVRGLILPIEPKGHGHNWYNFTSRIDMKALGWSGNPARLRDAMMKAMNAEGVPAHTWQRYILPAMTVFRAKNAYGQGCPWTCPYTKDVQYDPAAYPVAQKHCDTHFGMTMPLRAPNDTKVAKAVAHGIRKVFENVGKLDVDKILAPK